MQTVFQVIFLLVALVSMVVGFLLMLAPTRYPQFYAGFLSDRVLKREQTERGRITAIRVQGLLLLAVGAFFTLFFWSMPYT